MSESDILILKGKIDSLERIVDERWDSHDKRADERWSDLMDKMHENGRKLDNRPCAAHGEEMIKQCGRIKSMEEWKTIVNWAIGVIYVAVTGMMITKLFN